MICAVAATVFLMRDREQQAAGNASEGRAKVTNPASKAEIAVPAAMDATKLKAEVEVPAKEKEAILRNDLQEQKYQTAMKEWAGCVRSKGLCRRR